jgi:hypothetical protein
MQLTYEGGNTMASTTHIDLVELLETLPTERKQRSTDPQNTGICWFRSQEGYPDREMLLEHIENADPHTDDTNDAEDSCPEYDNARDAAFFEMYDSDMHGNSIDGEPENTAYTPWDSTFCVAFDQASQKYLLETVDKSMVFMGSSRPEGVVELLEVATLLDVAYSLYGVDLNDQCLGGSACRPWTCEVVNVDTSAALLGEVAAILQERESASELWIACTHFTGQHKHFALLAAQDAEDAEDTEDAQDAVNVFALHGTFEWRFKTTKVGADHAGECFRTIIFWRDADTDNMNPIFRHE